MKAIQKCRGQTTIFWMLTDGRTGGRRGMGIYLCRYIYSVAQWIEHGAWRGQKTGRRFIRLESWRTHSPNHGGKRRETNFSQLLVFSVFYSKMYHTTLEFKLLSTKSIWVGSAEISHTLYILIFRWWVYWMHILMYYSSYL